MVTQHFIIEGKYYGQVSRDYSLRTGGFPESYAYVCPICGDCWAKCPIEGRQFFVFTLPCRQHFYHRLAVPGSLIVSWDPEFCEALPPDVIRWEFDRHLDYAEKTLGMKAPT